VVDDNASNRDLLFRRLSHDGHHVTRAESGRRALEILGVEEFDVVLLDLMMPDLNGFQVLERLKADERLHNVPVIMISGLQEVDSVIRCIRSLWNGTAGNLHSARAAGLVSQPHSARGRGGRGRPGRVFIPNPPAPHPTVLSTDAVKLARGWLQVSISLYTSCTRYSSARCASI
jgi:CheY-like chemotaxis protein